MGVLLGGIGVSVNVGRGVKVGVGRCVLVALGNEVLVGVRLGVRVAVFVGAGEDVEVFETLRSLSFVRVGRSGVQVTKYLVGVV
jgi:hypothetical protein